MIVSKHKLVPFLMVIGAAFIQPYNAQATDYDIDPSHTTAQFSVRHLMVSNVRGEFTDIKGTVSYDPTNLAASKIDVVINPATVNTRVAKRDEHLKSPDFFNVAAFPTMAFKSKKIEKIADDKLKVSGDLTIHGVTKEVTLDVENLSPEMTDPWGMTRRGASATAKLNRADFGLTWNKALETGGVVVGDAVSITIDVEMTKKAEKK